MSKQCFNCGCEISLIGKTYKLKNQKALFCKECGEKVEPILAGIHSSEYEPIITLSKKFEEELYTTPLTPSSKRVVRREFDDLACERLAYPYHRKEFYASFSDSCRMISRAIKESCSILGEEISADLVTAGEVKVVSMLCGDYTSLIENAYTAMSVVLVHDGEKAIVTTKGVGEGFGNYQKLNKKFWKALMKEHPELDINTIYNREEILLSETK